MCEENDTLKEELVIKFTEDFDKLCEIIKSASEFKDKIKLHINELKKFKSLENVVNIATEVTSDCTVISKTVESIEQKVQKLNLSTISRRRKKDTEIKTNDLENKKTYTKTVKDKQHDDILAKRKENDSSIIRLISQLTEENEDRTENQKENEGISEEISEKEVDSPLDKESDVTTGKEVETSEQMPHEPLRESLQNDVHTEKEVDSHSEMETNLELDPEKEAVDAPEKERDKSSSKETEDTQNSTTTIDSNTVKPEQVNGLDKPKLGLIRLVPLKNLLSETSCFYINSDEESPKKKTHLSPQNIVELSDSDDEPLFNVLRNTLNATQGTNKKEPRKKFTPVRNPLLKDKSNDILKSKENQSRISSNSNRKQSSNHKKRKFYDSSDSNYLESEDEKSRRHKGAGKRESRTNSSTKSISTRSNECRSNNENRYSSYTRRNDISKQKTPKVIKDISEVTIDDFKRKCRVRLKRYPIPTAIIYKLKGQTRSERAFKRELKRNKKIMDSDSGSETEVIHLDDDSDTNSTSDSEVIPPRKRRGRKKSSDNSNYSDLDSEAKMSTSRKKRKLTANVNSSSGGDSDDSDNLDGDKNKKRKKIRKLINEKHLDDETKKAAKAEEERKKRIEERQKMYNQIYEKPENVEVDELILDFDEETKEPLLKVDNGLLKKLKPHQVNGVKFMWDACFETLKDCQEKPGSGCILAHCMGLGKTLQVVALSHTLLTNSELTRVSRVLIISPLSTLNNWAREFTSWIKFAHDKDVEIYDMSKYKDKNTRCFKLEEWFVEGGVCIVGYDMYRILSNEKTKGLRKKQRETLQKSLVDPGPDVVVCDEGHLLKNEKTSLSKAVTKIRTKRRIVLTGTPLQNNLKEYYCMIQFIKPNLLGTYKEYLNRFVNPITNGQYTDSTERDIRLMKHRSHILHKMLEACIQRRDYSVLAPYLPPKHEYVVFVTLSELQKQLYEFYMTTQREVIGETSGVPGKGAKLFQDFQDLRRIWTHPMNLRVNSDVVIRKKMARYDSDESMKDFIVENDETTSSESAESSSSEIEATEPPKPRVRTTRLQREISDHENEADGPAKDDPSEWWTKFVEDSDLNNIHHSPKLVLLMTILQRCEEIGDKLLVFSQSLQSLDVIEHFLSLIDRKTRGEEIEGDVGEFRGFWEPGFNYFRLDGSRTVENRENMCKSFNNVKNLNARLFLISTRAGGLGINLVAANRVVIFDVSWNPSHDTQSIFRVYRFGQVKPCYIYRLIALGTMEQKVYERQVTKQATAKRVIDEQQISRHYNQSDLLELYTYELEPSVPRETPILPKDRLFAELLSNHEKLLFKYHEHDSLLENEDSENLTEQERKAAWDEFEAEKTRPPQPAMQYMTYDRQAYLANYGNPAGTVTSNKIFGFRSDILLRLLNMKASQDHPEMTTPQIIQLVPEYLQRLYLEMNNGDPSLYKSLLDLHKTLEAPGGMYMNPLLFANQTPAPNAVINPYQAPIIPYGQVLPGTSGYNNNEVYDLD